MVLRAIWLCATQRLMSVNKRLMKQRLTFDTLIVVVFVLAPASGTINHYRIPSYELTNHRIVTFNP